MKRKTHDDFNPLSFNVGLARQVLNRRPAAPAAEPATAPADDVTAAPAAVTDSLDAAAEAAGVSDDEPTQRPLSARPEPAASAAASARKSGRPKKPEPTEPEPANTFRGGARQDLRIPLDEDRRDGLGDLVRQLNRRLRSRLPEAITFRALLTVMLAAEGEILTKASASPIGRTPARQDTLAATEAERDVAKVLAVALSKVSVREVERCYAEQIARLSEDADVELRQAA